MKFLSKCLLVFLHVALCSCYKRLSRSYRSKITQRLNGIDPSLVSLGAGSVAGVVGVGVACEFIEYHPPYCIEVSKPDPLDALKTKAQTFASRRESSSERLGMFDMAALVYEEEGIKGFYGGVFGVMFGQAFIKAAAFGSNAWALQQLLSLFPETDGPNLLELSIAAGFSGFASSFVINPIERIKILMQADNVGAYKSEIDCANKVIENDGVSGLVFRGIEATMAREIPGNVVYFVTYSLLMGSIIQSILGDAAPLLCGAATGMMAWIPGDLNMTIADTGNIITQIYLLAVYPSDVIKTNMQNTEGEVGKGFIETALELQKKFGFGIFFDGIQPKLYRAGVNHSVTFYIFELLCRAGGVPPLH